MPPTANGEGTPMRPCPPNGMHHVLRIGTANNRCWTGVDLAVPELAHLLIGCVLGEDELAGEEREEILENGTTAAWCGCHRFFRSCRVAFQRVPNVSCCLL